MPNTNIGYWIADGKIKGIKSSTNLLFFGGIEVPAGVVADDLYKYIKGVLDKGATIRGIESMDSFNLACNSALEVSFNNKSGTKWQSTSEIIKYKIVERRWWSKEEFSDWISQQLSPPSLQQQSSKQQASNSNNNVDNTPTTRTEDQSVEKTVEISSSSSPSLTTLVDIQAGKHGPHVTFKPAALDTLGIDVTNYDTSAVARAILEISPQLFAELLKDKTDLRETRNILNVKAKDNFTISSENLKLNTEVINLKKTIETLRARNLALEDSNKKKDQQITLLMNLLESSDSLTDMFSSLSDSVETSCGITKSNIERLVDIVGKGFSKNTTKTSSSSTIWANPNALTISSSGKNLVLFISADQLTKIEESPLFGGELNRLQENHFISVVFTDKPSLRATTKPLSEWNGDKTKSIGLFCMEYEDGWESEVEELKLSEVNNILSKVSYLKKSVALKFSSAILLSLSTTESEAPFAKLVEKELSSLSDETFSIVSTNSDSTSTITFPRCLAKAISTLADRGVDVCINCGGACPITECIFSPEQEVNEINEIENVQKTAKVPLKRKEETTQDEKESKKAKSEEKDKPNDSKKTTTKNSTTKGTSVIFWCTVCGLPVSNKPHRNGKPCPLDSFDVCNKCGADNHKIGAHYVVGGPVRAFMQAIHGAGFEFIEKNKKRRDHNDEED